MEQIKAMINDKGEKINVELLTLYDLSQEEFEDELVDSKLIEIKKLDNPKDHFNKYFKTTKENNFDFESDKYDYYHVSKRDSKRVNSSYYARVEK